MHNTSKWVIKDRKDSYEVCKEKENELSTDSDDWEDEQCRNRNVKREPSEQSYGTSQSRFKTSLCRNYEASGSCPYKHKCKFAHGLHQIRREHSNFRFRTKLCISFKREGYCQYGSCCNYLHPRPMYFIGNLLAEADPTFAPVILEAGRRAESRLMSILEYSQ